MQRCNSLKHAEQPRLQGLTKLKPTKQHNDTAGSSAQVASQMEAEKEDQWV